MRIFLLVLAFTISVFSQKVEFKTEIDAYVKEYENRTNLYPINQDVIKLGNNYYILNQNYLYKMDEDDLDYGYPLFFNTILFKLDKNGNRLGHKNFLEDTLFLGWGIKKISDEELRVWGIHSHAPLFEPSYTERYIGDNNFKYYDIDEDLKIENTKEDTDSNNRFTSYPILNMHYDKNRFINYSFKGDTNTFRTIIDTNFNTEHLYKYYRNSSNDSELFLRGIRNMLVKGNYFYCLYNNNDSVDNEWRDLSRVIRINMNTGDYKIHTFEDVFGFFTEIMFDKDSNLVAFYDEKVGSPPKTKDILHKYTINIETMTKIDHRIYDPETYLNNYDRILAKDGNVLISGHIATESHTKIPFAAKINDDFTGLKWIKTFEEDTLTIRQISDIYRFGDNEYFLVGYNPEDYKMTFIKMLDPIADIKGNEITEDDITIAPNPVNNGVLKYKCKFTPNKLTIRNLTGSNIMSFNYPANEVELHDLSPGTYFAVFEIKGEKIVRKFVLM